MTFLGPAATAAPTNIIDVVPDACFTVAVPRLFSAAFDVDTNPNFQAATVGTWAYSGDPVKSASGVASLASGTQGYAFGTMPGPGSLHIETTVGATPTGGNNAVILFCADALGNWYAVAFSSTSFAIAKVTLGSSATLDIETITVSADDMIAVDYSYTTGAITATLTRADTVIATLTASDASYKDKLLAGLLFNGTSGAVKTSFTVTGTA